MVIPGFVVWSAALVLVAIGVAAGWAAARLKAWLAAQFIRHSCNGLTVWDGAFACAGGGAEISLYFVIKRRTGAVAPAAAAQGDAAPPALAPQRSGA